MKGKPLIRHIYDQLAAHFDEILISTTRGHGLPHRLLFGPLHHSAHVGMAGPVAGDDEGPRLEWMARGHVPCNLVFVEIARGTPEEGWGFLLHQCEQLRRE